jgi:hypothetical protein
MRSSTPTPITLALATLAVVMACVVPAAVLPASAAAANTVRTFAEGAPEAPFSFAQPLDPALTVGDAGDQQLSLTTPIERDLPLTVVARSVALDLGRSDLEKEFLSLSWGAAQPRGTNLFISYSVDGGAWLPAVGGGGFDIPRGTHGRTIAYGVSLTSGDAAVSPALDDIAIEYTRWTGKPTDPSGGGGTSHTPQSDRKPGSGTYTYPDAGGDAAGVDPGGSGGSPGTGSGTGSGAGYAGASGAGTGSVSSAAAATSALSEAVAAPPSSIPSPPAPSPSGAPESVSGLPVDAGQTISGTAFEPAGSAPAAGSASTSAPAGPPGRVPFGPIALVITALAAMFFVPWLVAAAQLRKVTGYDFERARLFGPFRPLGR